MSNKNNPKRPQKILITSALPYANGPLHFGHIAGAYLPADCYARFERLMQNDVLFISGSDEYGIAITLSAELAHRSPEEHVAIFHETNKKFFQKLKISFDHFSRTSWPGHQAPVQQYFADLLTNGFIEERTTDQLYSEADSKFLADRYVVGTCPKCGFNEARGDECPKCGASYEATDLIDPRSKLSNAKLSKKQTKHWFLLLDKCKEKLTSWVEQKNWKPNVTNFVKGYIKELRPRAITRDMNWGVPIPLPNTEGKVLYVWFDAPIGYISATMEWALLEKTPERWKDYWCDPQTKLVHFIGKDNIPFHAVIFPAMTMGQNQPFKLVDELPANEFYNLEGRQFSKSDGWTIDLEEFFNSYTVDQIRYAIASNAPETSDSEFTWHDFQLRCNSDLLGKWGNLVNRVVVFAHNHSGGCVPALDNLQPVDFEFLENIRRVSSLAKGAYGQFKLRKASQLIMELAQIGNGYFDSKRPWEDAKKADGKARLETTIACCFECLKALALISYPVIPDAAQKLFHLIGFSGLLEDRDWDVLLSETISPGQSLEQPTLFFKRIEDEQISEEVRKLKQLSKSKESKKVEDKGLISYEDFQKLDLRVGKIMEAEPVSKSKKLFKLQVDIGSETRQIVAGIREHYEAEQLIGKKVVVVANLKPATLMGVESQGMLLAGKDEHILELVSITDVRAGGAVS
ncbi:Methionine--tRNA ligase [Chlamydiales bacterium STE3]|nr:Methionine--tRNA ligase [Chlamydiales bacterium STE3]